MISWFDRLFLKINNDIMLCEYSLRHWARSYLEYMQYTGLNDKNGKEIYECDICLYQKNVYVVEWMLGKFIFKKYTSVECHNIGDVYPSVEVVGNSYENTELLNKLE